jgi:hypothetical protein
MRDHCGPERRAILIAGKAALEDLANKAADESQSLLSYLSITRSVLFHQFLSAAECDDRGGVATIAGSLLSCLKEVGKLTGDLREVSAGLTVNNTVNVIATPQFVTLHTGLLQITRAYPEARGAIIALLRQLDDRPAMPSPPMNGAQLAIEHQDGAHVG